jgi:hypothetical protein
MDHRQHIVAASEPFFDQIPSLDWETDFLATARITERIIREFASDKALFRRCLERVPSNIYLWNKCEEDISEDKIVLWDDIEKGIRIRLRMSTTTQERLAHCHRFSFTNLVLKGEYIHWLYHANKCFDETISNNDLYTVTQHIDTAGDVFSIHHNTLHSTPFLQPETISLVLRGNPIKERAPVMFKESRSRQEFIISQIDSMSKHKTLPQYEPNVADVGDMFWRVGEDLEPVERRKERQMTYQKFNIWCSRLAELGLI